VSSVEPTSQPSSGADKSKTDDAAKAAAPTAPKKASASSIVVARENQYLITTQASGFGFHTFSVDQVQQALERMPNVKIVRTLAPRGFAALTTELTGPTKTLVAEMPHEQYVTLKQSVPPSVIVEPNYIYTISDPVATVAAASATMTKQTPVIPLQPKPFPVTIQVVGPDNSPLAGALVVMYGTGLPAQGTTDANGNVTVQVYGGTIDTVAALYVKPAADHWEMYVQQPRLQDGVSNVVQLTPLSASFASFPQQQMYGWGQRAMNLDKLPPEFAGKGVKVALIDSGCGTTHPDLSEITKGLDVIANDPNAWRNDAECHGSHCAGIIAGNASRNFGIRGFAPEAEVFVYKVFPRGAVSDIISALHECMAEQVDVVNLSLGGDQVSQALEIELARAKSLGIACIVAAGNNYGSVQYPASSPNVLAVAAMGKMGEFPPTTYHAQQMLQGGNVTPEGYFAAAFSAHGQEIKVCAPSVAIVSSVPPQGYASWDGTSMATPHVTGLAVLILAHHPSFQSGVLSQRNAARVDELFRIIMSSARPLDFRDPTRTGAGLPDAQRALTVSQAVPAGPVALADVIASLRNMLQPTGGVRPDGNGAQPVGGVQSLSAAPPSAPGGIGAPSMAPGTVTEFASPQQARDYLIKEMRQRLQAAGIFL
jgi:subtilisin family serine protease